MFSDVNWDNVEAKENSGFEKIPAGGYVCKVITYEPNEEKCNIKLLLDIAEGKYKGHGEAVEAAVGKDYGYIKGYISWRTAAAQGMAKHLLNLLDSDNPGKAVLESMKKNNYNVLIRLTVGIIVGEEEYQKQDGNIGIKLSLPKFVPVADIRSGNFKVPELKKLAQNTDSPMGAFGTAVKETADTPF